MHASDLLELSIAELLEAYRTGETTPTEVVGAVFDRFDLIDPALNVSLSLSRDEARAAAEDSTERWRTGSDRALEGIPFGVKDNIDVRGMVTTAGVRGLTTVAAAADADVVGRLRDAGAIPVGKLQLGAFAFGEPHNPDFGVTVNPWGSGRFTGGSSTGPAAAVAAGAVPFALGTDSGGSVRIPASHCGITALKPTYELIPRSGVFPSTATLDHVGILARSAADVRLVLEVVAAAGSSREAPKRLGVLGGPFLDLCDAAARESFARAVAELESAGFSVTQIDLGALEGTDQVTVGIAAAEIARSMAGVPADVTVSDSLAGFVTYGEGIDDAALAALLARREEVIAVLRDEMAGVDVLVAPTMVGVAPDLETLTTTTSEGPRPWMEIAARNTMPFNLVGLPAVSVPSRPADDDLPFGLQVIGHAGGDADVLAVAEAYQRQTAYHLLRPDLPASRG